MKKHNRRLGLCDECLRYVERGRKLQRHFIDSIQYPNLRCDRCGKNFGRLNIRMNYFEEGA
jgi:hypothetical protein